MKPCGPTGTGDDSPQCALGAPVPIFGQLRLTWRSYGRKDCCYVNARQGMDTVDAPHSLTNEGSYPFEVASDIASAAIVAYCPEYRDF